MGVGSKAGSRLGTACDSRAIDAHAEAELFSEYIESFADPQAYAISHIGWRLQKRAYWSTLGLYDREATLGLDARAVSGNFLFSLGPNNKAGGGRFARGQSSGRRLRSSRNATIDHPIAQAVPSAQPPSTSLAQWTPSATRLRPTSRAATAAMARM